MEHLEKQLDEIKASIQGLCDNDLEIKGKITKLTSIPGIGLIAATTAICELPQLGSTHLRQLASLAGVAPYEAVAR
ncbi:transposase [Alphaproteobacteria bacterium]